MFSPICMKLGQNVCINEILKEFEMGHIGSKTGSVGQSLEKTCVCSRGYIFSPILMNLSQTVSLD